MKCFKLTAAVFLLDFIVFQGAAMAGLDNEFYIKAKQYYIESNYKLTIKFMNRYKKVDKTFLKENPDVLFAINEVLKYCKNLENTTLSLRGLDKPPLLPE